jgi:hypothetical protein
MRTRILELSLIGGVLLGTAWSEAAETSRGRIVEVRPDAGSFVVEVATSGSEPIETVFFVDDLTRIRESGGVVSFSAVPSGGNVVVTYDRLEGRNVARVVELYPGSPDPAVAEPLDAREDLEDKQRYEESQAAKLDVLEEEIEELRLASETESRSDLARSNVWSERLEVLLGRARERLERLASLRSQGAWERGRRELETAMTELGAELGRARASITGR